VDNIVSTQQRVAKMYFEDGSVEQACPPLKALLHIMAEGHYDGKGLDSVEVRNLFKRDRLLASDWYFARLKERQSVERKLWTRHAGYLQKFLKRKTHEDEAERLGVSARLDRARATLREVESDRYLEKLQGSIGAQPIGNFR
jgi:hypothetical protein